MSGRYAERTEVSTEKTRMELERVLSRYGAERFAYASESTRAMIMFEAHGRRIRFIIPLPSPAEERFTHYRRSQYSSLIPRSENAAREAHEQASRQIWRALLLVVKAKLEAVAAGITTFEDEFLAHTVLPDGRTFGEWAKPQLDAIGTGGMPPMLAIGGGK
jgi:hypothetical protein